ncbi:phosphotransferase [Paenibacillus montanisoli]|uniref:Aminoglycoside phosphotransferase domain-containing protein n=1 Tax=Paenibacillus montanisoli TaxID=2081970 RepID=A0A328U8H4_9BACL|nr:phosphotransferase [Paenibacillus montanisoli]RAP77255.1 hypothetical protein DL346_01785 [Paenibacillus montanisoli]
MYKHSFFHLYLHDDEELASILGASVAERATLHEWPLSCVQRIRMSDASTIIFKVQAEPSIEAQFYNKASSPLLVSSRVIEQNDTPDALLLEHIDAPFLSDITMDTDEALRFIDDMTNQISQIEGDLPYFYKIGSLPDWGRFTGALVRDLETLVRRGTFQKTDHDGIQTIASYCNDSSVVSAIQSRSGLVHGDLNGGNIIMHPEGTKVIDWQRPVYGPIELNRANLLVSLGIDAKPYVATGVMSLLYILNIAWFTQCALYWFPPGAEAYDTEIVKFVDTLNCLPKRMPE